MGAGKSSNSFKNFIGSIFNFNYSLRLPGQYDVGIHVAVLALIIFGVFMIASVKAASTAGIIGILFTVAKHLVFAFISYYLMCFLANNFTMKRAAKLYLPIGILLLAILASTLLFEPVDGSRAWIHIGVGSKEISIQPSEFMKVYMLVIMAVFIEMAGHKNYSAYKIIRNPLIFYGLTALLIALQPDIGTLAIFTLLVVVCFLIPSHKSLHGLQKLTKIGLAVGTAFLLFVSTEKGSSLVQDLPVLGHITTRVNSAINPFEEQYAGGYQLINGMYGIARGGIKGKGFGESVQKYGYLSQPDNDFIFSIVIEEFGLMGLLLILVCYGTIILRLFMYAFKTRSDGYKILLIGTAMYIFIHFAVNIGGVSGLIPLTGVPLLFISSGGSSLMAVMCSVGISQAVIARIRRQGSAVTGKQKKRASA